MWGQGLVAENSGGSEYYVAHDAEGSVVALTSAAGATEDTIEYEPFGGVLSETAAKSAPSDAAEVRRGAARTHWALPRAPARDLDPTTGTFLSRDPVAPLTTQPAVSPYAFVNDQPTVLADPSGESAEGGYYDSADAEIDHDLSVYENNNNVVDSFVGDVTGLNDSPLQTVISASGDIGAGVDTGYDLYEGYEDTNGLESY